MWESIFYWTGVAVWVSIGCSIGFVLALMTRDAFVSAWHVVRVWRHGWLKPKSKHPAWSILTPFKTWLYFWLEAPRYVERHDGKGGRIYRPGRKPTGREQYDG